MNIDDRIKGLIAAASADGNEFERYLSRGSVIYVGPAITVTAGISTPPLVVLEGTVAFFKRFCDQSVNLCSQYGHRREDPPLNEVTAWRLARAMGDPWQQMLPTAVLRRIEDHGGALINEKRGRADLGAVLQEATSQVLSAGFWDALVGQQDRHPGNFRYDSASRKLGLIDHGFAFAKPGDLHHAGIFHAFRISQAGTVTQKEMDALEALLASDDLHGLRDLLDEDRAEALEVRASKMLNNKLILPARTF